MSQVLAYAQQPGGVSNVTVVLVGVAVLSGICGLATVLIGVAFARRHRQRELIMVAAIFWGLLCALSVGKALNDQSNWSQEATLRLQSGYYTQQQEQADAPRLPWMTWTVLGIGYCALLLWALTPPSQSPDASSGA